MPAIWSSRRKEVLEWWADVERREKAYIAVCRKVKKETGREVVVSTGFGDERPMGLARNYSEQLPAGWKYGWGKRDSGFMAPRAKGEGSAEAKALVKRLIDARPYPRREANERFGVPCYEMFGLHAITPGLELINGRLYVNFGEHDFDPAENHRMRQFFSPVARSAYYRAKEKIETRRQNTA